MALLENKKTGNRLARQVARHLLESGQPAAAYPSGWVRVMEVFPALLWPAPVLSRVAQLLHIIMPGEICQGNR